MVSSIDKPKSKAIWNPNLEEKSKLRVDSNVKIIDDDIYYLTLTEFYVFASRYCPRAQTRV